MNDTLLTSVNASPVPEHLRLATLPKHFGRHMLTVETRIYGFMAQFARTYSGGLWHFIELSNGGFYMRPPDEAYELRVDSNGFEGRMSADAAGITVCLFAFSHLSFQYATDIFGQHFHWLREFAVSHAEAGSILAAID